jgi:hypothetical protein
LRTRHAHAGRAFADGFDVDVHVDGLGEDRRIDHCHHRRRVVHLDVTMMMMRLEATHQHDEGEVWRMKRVEQRTGMVSGSLPQRERIPT